MVPRVMLMVLAAFVVASCGDQDQTKLKEEAEKKRAAEADRAEEELMADSAKAANALRSRMMQRLRLSDGVLVITDDINDSWAFSENTPWAIHCGYGGVEVVIGFLDSGGEDSSAPTVRLSDAVLEEPAYKQLMPALISTMKQIMPTTGRGL